MKHSRNFDPHSVAREECHSPSVTVPDMSLTPQEILLRFAQGRPLNVSQNLHYTGDDYFPDTRAMDIIEREEYIEANAAHLEELKSDIESKKKARKDARRKLKPPVDPDQSIDDLKIQDDNDPDIK